MPFQVKETTIPGVGKKYELFLNPEESVAVLLRSSGERAVFHRERVEDDYEKLFTLTDSQARTFGLFLVGAYYQPITGEIGEDTASGEYIRWYSVDEESTLSGVRRDEVVIQQKTGATLLGLERDGKVESVIENDVAFEVGDRLIVIGTESAHRDLENVLS